MSSWIGLRCIELRRLMRLSKGIMIISSFSKVGSFIREANGCSGTGDKGVHVHVPFAGLHGPE